MQASEPSTRDRLIATAARLFGQKGYCGTGLSEILAESQAPKGSLYHHFPDGKADLALAAADWTAALMMRIMDDAFTPAATYRDGVTTFCYKMAKLFDMTDATNACPVAALLFDGPENDTFRSHAAAIFDQMSAHIAGHARRLHLRAPQADIQAETLLIAINGGWTLARSRRNADVLRSLPSRLFPTTL